MKNIFYTFLYNIILTIRIFILIVLFAMYMATVFYPEDYAFTSNPIISLCVEYVLLVLCLVIVYFLYFPFPTFYVKFKRKNMFKKFLYKFYTNKNFKKLVIEYTLCYDLALSLSLAVFFDDKIVIPVYFIIFANITPFLTFLLCMRIRKICKKRRRKKLNAIS